MLEEREAGMKLTEASREQLAQAEKAIQAQKEINEIRERELKAERDELLRNIEERRQERLATTRRSEGRASVTQQEQAKAMSTEAPEKTRSDTHSGADIKREERAHKAGLKKQFDEERRKGMQHPKARTVKQELSASVKAASPPKDLPSNELKFEHFTLQVVDNKKDKESAELAAISVQRPISGHRNNLKKELTPVKEAASAAAGNEESPDVQLKSSPGGAIVDEYTDEVGAVAQNEDIVVNSTPQEAVRQQAKKVWGNMFKEITKTGHVVENMCDAQPPSDSASSSQAGAGLFVFEESEQDGGEHEGGDSERAKDYFEKQMSE